MDNVVIVGGGAAGARSAERLRQLGYEGRLRLFAAERHLPYDRPPLSKAALTSASVDTTFAIDYTDLDVEVRLGEPVHRLEHDRIWTDRGDIAFDGLVVATGSTADPLDVVARHPRVRYLRTVDDATEIRRVLAADLRIMVVGAGWVGAEVASTAAALGARVTVVERGTTPAGALPGEIGQHLVAWYAQAGIHFLANTTVTEVRGRTVALSDGTTTETDLVLVGVGGRPAVDWLAGSPVRYDRRGVLVDASLRTSVPGVVAAGDVVCYPSAAAGRRLTIGHRDDAYASAATAAQTLLGSGEPPVFDPVPYFWSEQFGRMLQSAGWLTEEDQVIWRGRPSDASWAACWVRDSRLRGVFAVDRPRDVARARRLIGTGEPVDVAALVDPDSPIQVCSALTALDPTTG
ncbi:NAD(P)/FAD-dependent oxidoreductase [Saccharopolyspora shandongensis]|uniref:NAD(P)/FAD-dependent oxidoreductase n=1 Tax=Saccharopolyspora shandongensis TaxID=418495 RepID=UPI0033DDC8D8